MGEGGETSPKKCQSEGGRVDFPECQDRQSQKHKKVSVFFFVGVCGQTHTSNTQVRTTTTTTATQAYDSNTRFLVCVTVMIPNPADGVCADQRMAFVLIAPMSAPHGGGGSAGSARFFDTSG